MGDPKTSQERNPRADKIKDVIKEAVESNEIPKIYFNGFTTSLGNSDILIVLQNNEKPVALLNASYTIAKTLVHKLNGLIGVIETASKNNIMTTDDVVNFLTGMKQEK